MRYRLAVLTHGRGETLGRALNSFAQHVTPAPAETFVLHDNPWIYLPDDLADRQWFGDLGHLSTGSDRLGFCGASQMLWRIAASDEGEQPEYVFWLEHDFLFNVPVDLADVAAVLESHSDLAQMAFPRQPLNAPERERGSVVPDGAEYLYSDGVQFGRPLPWRKHGVFFTTNPSLMRRKMMVDNPWPDYTSECEGLFGSDLRSRGYRFGMWGDGSEIVEHIGERSGHGY